MECCLGSFALLYSSQESEFRRLKGGGEGDKERDEEQKKEEDEEQDEEQKAKRKSFSVNP